MLGTLNIPSCTQEEKVDKLNNWAKVEVHLDLDLGNLTPEPILAF